MAILHEEVHTEVINTFHNNQKPYHDTETVGPLPIDPAVDSVTVNEEMHETVAELKEKHPDYLVINMPAHTKHPVFYTVPELPWKKNNEPKHDNDTPSVNEGRGGLE